MKKHFTWWQWLLLVSFAIALAFGAWEIEQVGNHMQYIVPAPAQASGEDAKPNQPIADAVRQLQEQSSEWDTTMQCWTAGGVVERTAFSSSSGSAAGRLELIGEDGLLVRPLYLQYGRLPYTEEIERGDKVILLDEQLALTLFRVADPLGREVSVGGITCEVIGILRHSKQVGDNQDYGAYLPLNAVIDEYFTVDALLVEAVPVAGMGANVSFETVVENWRAGGSLYDLGKESMGAGLWLRVLLFLVGITLVLRLIRWLNGRVRYYAKRYRAQLQVRYAIRMMPEVTGVVLLFAIGYGACAIAVAWLMNYIIQPVYTFPEWIPAILVEWEDIATAFWNVWQLPAVMVEWRTPEILRLRWLTLLTQGCAAAEGVLLAILYARWHTSAERMAESLHAMYREGVIVSTVSAARPIAMSELGYVLCHDAPDAPMVRIINVRRVLEQLPAGMRDGSFVLEVVDELIPQNNGRWHIACQNGVKTIREVNRDWDLQLPVQVLANIVYGDQTFADFLESHAGYDMKMRSPAMDGMFDHHLTYGRK